MGKYDHLPINERQRKDLEYYDTLPNGPNGPKGWKGKDSDDSKSSKKNCSTKPLPKKNKLST